LVPTIEFIETFMEIYNASAAFLIIFLIGHTVSVMHKLDRDLLKARLFLDDAVMQRTWIYISIAGASYSMNIFIKFMVNFTTMGEVLKPYYIVDFTQLIFLVAFFLTVYNWYMFLDTFRKPNTNFSF
jgi:hypothetical protein